MDNLKKQHITIVIILAVLLVGLAAFAFFMPKPNSKPDENVIPQGNDGIEIFTPKGNDRVSSPLKITGQVKGNGWAGFEGEVGIVKLFDNTNKELGMAILTAKGEWMQTIVDFETQLWFNYPGDGEGKLVFYNSNASGEPSRDKTFELPVKLSQSSAETTIVKAYFNNTKSDPQVTCNLVFPVERVMPKTEAVAMAALEELLKGPTDLEKNAEFSTSIPSGVKIQKLTVENGVAKVDFNQALQEGVGGSCRVSAIRAQITQTLKQFPTVKSVEISINGSKDDILQP